MCWFCSEWEGTCTWSTCQLCRDIKRGILLNYHNKTIHKVAGSESHYSRNYDMVKNLANDAFVTICWNTWRLNYWSYDWVDWIHNWNRTWMLPRTNWNGFWTSTLGAIRPQTDHVKLVQLQREFPWSFKKPQVCCLFDQNQQMIQRDPWMSNAEALSSRMMGHMTIFGP